MKKSSLLLFALTGALIILSFGCGSLGEAAEEPAQGASKTLDGLLTDMLDAYNARLRIDQDVAALDDEAARRIADPKS